MNDILIVFGAFLGVWLLGRACYSSRTQTERLEDRNEEFEQNMWQINNRQLATDPQTQGWEIKEELLELPGPDFVPYKTKEWIFYCSCGNRLGPTFGPGYLPCNKCKKSWVTGPWTPLP
jgi:hypothetical protein